MHQWLLGTVQALLLIDVPGILQLHRIKSAAPD